MILLFKIKESTFYMFLQLCLVWVTFAICFQIFMITTEYINPALTKKIGNYLTWKLDGTFKNDPDNIWYEKK